MKRRCLLAAELTTGKVEMKNDVILNKRIIKLVPSLPVLANHQKETESP